ncbi:MAG: efflux RND transporter permease subunit [Myxococcales bacterium]|nr:efflux RND transporter permease subunit [Myxococcales bacterium]
MIEGLVKRSATVLLISFCALLFGFGAYKSLPREAAPDVKVPFVMVATPYVGVSSEDIETLITEPLEAELAGLKGLKKLSSVSAEGVSMVYLEFETDVVIEDALQKVRDRVNRAKPEMPQDVSETEVNEISFADMPILIVTIAGDVDEVILKKLGEDLKDRVERLPGVLSADLNGGRSRQVRVQIDPNRLGHFGLSMNDVIMAVQDENVNIPGGSIAVGNARYLLRVPGEFGDPKEIESIAVKRRGDRTIFVRDIGRVVDDFEDRATYARMNGETAVSLGVSKRTGSNIEEVASLVKKLVVKESASWPEYTSYQVLGDQSKMVGNMVADLENGIITALILVIGVIMFFMGIRNSLFVATAIPLSFLLGILTLYLLDITLNMVVLFSLILVLGMLVDNAIVIVENVYRHAEMGKPMRQAAIDGTGEVAMAVAASTATTVAVFIPLIFWTGVMGEFMGYMPKTVVIVLIASLIVAIAVLPVLTAKLMKVHVRESKEGSDAPVVAAELSPVMRGYSKVLGFAIEHRYISIGVGLATLVGTFMAYGVLNHGTEFFPESEPDRAIISITAADGTDIEATDAIVRKIEGILSKEENVDVYVAEVGISGDPQNPMAGGDSSSPNSARITVDFLPDTASARPKDKVRIEKTTATVDRLRARLEEFASAEIKINKENMGPPVGTPVSVEVSGEKYHEVGAYAAKVRRGISGIEGTAKLTDNYRVGRPEMRLRIDREATKRVGASTRAVAGTMRTALAGTKASSLRGTDDDVDIVVEVEPRFKEDLQSLLAIRIPGRTDTSPDTFPVPLSSIANYELAGGSGAIMHIDQKRVVTISGDVTEGSNANEVQKRIVEWIQSAEVPGDFEVRLGGANDEQKKSEEFLGRAFLIGIFLIAVVLVSQFNRFDLPIIILASVVLSLVGVLWGLIITGTPFGIIMTGIGVISLAGVVVNNAIVLLDYVEQLRAQGASMREALMQAGIARFRPVLLTAGTTILGLLPMALNLSIDFSKMSISSGSQSTQMWGSMAVAVVSGLGFATVLTLVLVPTMYSIAEDVRNLRVRIFGKS